VPSVAGFGFAPHGIRIAAHSNFLALPAFGIMKRSCEFHGFRIWQRIKLSRTFPQNRLIRLNPSLATWLKYKGNGRRNSALFHNKNNYTPIPLIAEKKLAKYRRSDSPAGMIRGGFLDPSIRAHLIAQVRDGKAETRLTRRANALPLLDDGMSCEEIAKVLYLDDDTIRYWYQLYSQKGLSWLADFGYKGRICELTTAQQNALKSWVAQMLPRTTTMVGEWIEKSYGVSYSPSALIKLLRRNDMDYRKPELVPRKLNPAKQQAFIDGYENLLNNLGDDEAVVFAAPCARSLIWRSPRLPRWPQSPLLLPIPSCRQSALRWTGYGQWRIAISRSSTILTRDYAKPSPKRTSTSPDSMPKRP
jgi:transposase